MKKITQESTSKIQNSDICAVFEYGFDEKDIDISTIEISGKFPENAWLLNEKVKEIIYVVEGEGKLHKENEVVSFKKGDAVLIETNEKYFWEANCKAVMVCSPAWCPNQHKIIAK